MLDHLQNCINLLVALLVGNTNNCWRAYNAEGATLLVAVLVSRRQKNISLPLNASGITLVSPILLCFFLLKFAVAAIVKFSTLIKVCRVRHTTPCTLFINVAVCIICNTVERHFMFVARDVVCPGALLYFHICKSAPCRCLREHVAICKFCEKLSHHEYGKQERRSVFCYRCGDCGGVEECSTWCRALRLSVHIERLRRGFQKIGPR